MNEKLLFPSCSETVEHLGIKPSEIPYIKKRVKELSGNNEEFKEILEHFTDLVGKPDGSGDGWISEGLASDYNKIKSELLVKRIGNKICPFCKEEQTDLNSHMKSEHREELVIAVGCLNEEEYKKMRKELILESL